MQVSHTSCLALEVDHILHVGNSQGHQYPVHVSFRLCLALTTDRVPQAGKAEGSPASCAGLFQIQTCLEKFQHVPHTMRSQPKAHVCLVQIYFRNPRPAIMSLRQATEYTVLDVELTGLSSGRMQQVCWDALSNARAFVAQTCKRKFVHEKKSSTLARTR